MKYLLLCYDDEQGWSKTPESEQQQTMTQVCQVLDDMRANGHYLSVARLEPTATAKSVRVRNGQALVTDGPFAETREQLGGYFLIDAANLDEAIRIAGRLPGSPRHTIEIRPVMELAGLPVR